MYMFVCLPCHGLAVQIDPFWQDAIAEGAYLELHGLSALAARFAAPWQACSEISLMPAFGLAGDRERAREVSPQAKGN